MDEIVVRAFRFNPSAGEAPRWDSYRVQRVSQMTVLDALFAIQNEQDDSLSFRSACRVGMCGSCGMMINGKPRLACQTGVEQVGAEFTVEPLRNLPVLKDLVADMDPFMEKYARVIPYLVPKDPEAPPLVLPADSDERGIIDENLQCITCGLCYAGCGAATADEEFLGPAALNRAYTLIQDPRDATPEERMKVVEDPRGIWRCRTQIACTAYCPRHLSPTHTIQQLRVKAIRRRFGRVPGK